MFNNNQKYPFKVGSLYLRREVFSILGIESQGGGNWFTGYASYGDDWFLFCNIGSKGRTGHDYANYFCNDELVWYGKTGSSLKHASIQSMIGGKGHVYIFYREDNRSPFIFAGIGYPCKIKDSIPVQITWSFDLKQEFTTEFSNGRDYDHGDNFKPLEQTFIATSKPKKPVAKQVFGWKFDSGTDRFRKTHKPETPRHDIELTHKEDSIAKDDKSNSLSELQEIDGSSSSEYRPADLEIKQTMPSDNDHPSSSDKNYLSRAGVENVDQEYWRSILAASSLSQRTLNVLTKNFSTLDDFLSFDSGSFIYLQNCGEKTANEIVHFFNELNNKGENTEVLNSFLDRQRHQDCQDSSKIITKFNCKASWQAFVKTLDISMGAKLILLKYFSTIAGFLAFDPDQFFHLKHCRQKQAKDIAQFQENLASAINVNIYKDASITDDNYYLPLTKTPTEESIQLLPLFGNIELSNNMSVEKLHPDFKAQTPLNDIAFPVRSSNVFRDMGLSSLGELLLTSSNELMIQNNFGKNSLSQVQEIVRSYIFSLNLDVDRNINDEEKINCIDYSSYQKLIHSFVANNVRTLRNQTIVCSRLGYKGNIPTLEELGNQFGVTRERVRQIEAKGIRRLAKKSSRDILHAFWVTVKDIASRGGGIISLTELSPKIQDNYDWPAEPEISSLRELLGFGEDDRLFVLSNNHVKTHETCLKCDEPQKLLSGLDFEVFHSYHLAVIANKLSMHCLSQCNEVSIDSFHVSFLEKIISQQNKLYKIHENQVYQYDCWLLNYGDKLEEIIIYVLKRHGQPMHFRELADEIRKVSSKYNGVSDQSVHSALMRNDSIEIFKRGTYGLKEWGMGGYRSISTAIEEVLNQSGLPLSKNKIISKLSSEFSGQYITNALNTWTSRFQNIGQGYYDKAESWRKRKSQDLLKLLPHPLSDLAKYLISNNNCSYKIVLALVFIRCMNEEGSADLQTLKKRFYKYYLNRHETRNIVEAKNCFIYNISKLNEKEIIKRSIKEPLKSLLHSGFWEQREFRLCLKSHLKELLLSENCLDLFSIILIKEIDEYYARINSDYPVINAAQSNEMETEFPDIQLRLQEDVDESSYSSSNGLSINIKTKSRAKIKL